MRSTNRPFEVTTPVLLYSVVKAAVGLTAVLLAARGDLDLDSDCAELADQPAWWPVGEPGEHVYTYGHLISGIVQGATGGHVHQVWASEIARPLGLDITFSPPPDLEPLRDPSGAFERGITARTQTRDPRLWQPRELTKVAVVNALTTQDAPVVPAVLGWGSAAAIADMYAFWSGTAGHLPGKPAVWERSRQPHTTGHDHVMDQEYEWALGTVVEGPIWGMGGIGGCAGWHDGRTGLSIGLTGPVLGMGPALEPLEAAIDAL
ncbi:MAG: serine hydrolase [Euzebya sp.]